MFGLADKEKPGQIAGPLFDTPRLPLVVMFTVMVVSRRIRRDNRSSEKRQSNDCQHVLPELHHPCRPPDFIGHFESADAFLDRIIHAIPHRNLHGNQDHYAPVFIVRTSFR
jgi:hypothetical protein